MSKPPWKGILQDKTSEPEPASHATLEFLCFVLKNKILGQFVSGQFDAFELWCWRRLLRVPWTARRSNQSILREINPEYSLEGLMLKLKLQYFGHLMRRDDSLEETLMLGKIEGKRRRDDRG